MDKLFVIFLLVLMIQFVSAEIILQDSFEDVYSFGDPIDVSFSLEKKIDISGYLDTYLVCNGKELLVSKLYLQVEANEKENFSFSFPANLDGNCYYQINFDEEEEKSQQFEISDEISIEFNVNKKIVYPGEELILNGSAIKANGEYLEGSVLVSSGSIVDRTFEVDNGKFSGTFLIGNTTSYGKYSFFIEASYRNSEEEIINSGKIFFEVEVKQKPTKIQINSIEEIDPPGNVTLDFFLVDQGSVLIPNETILLKVFNPQRDIVYEGAFSSEDSFEFPFERDAQRGAWDFNFYFGNIFSSKQIFVGENPDVSAIVFYDSGESYLRITNEGNIPYQGVVSVFLNDGVSIEEIPINVDLEVGDMYDFSLNYDGDYNLTFQGNDLGQFILTGASVGLDLGINLQSYWIILTVLLVGGIGVLLFKKRKVIIQTTKKLREGNSKMYSQTFKTETLKFSGKKAYIAFFKFGDFFNKAKIIASKYGWSFRHVEDNIYFVLFYSAESGPEIKLLNFARELSEAAALDYGAKLSIAIHSDRLQNEDNFLKRFSSLGRKLLGFSKGEILVSKNFYDSLGDVRGSVRYFDLEDGILEAYSI